SFAASSAARRLASATFTDRLNAPDTSASQNESNLVCTISASSLANVIGLICPSPSASPPRELLNTWAKLKKGLRAEATMDSWARASRTPAAARRSFELDSKARATRDDRRGSLNVCHHSLSTVDCCALAGMTIASRRRAANVFIG